MPSTSFIEKLRQKPRHVRVQIMWSGVIVSALVLFIFWVWSLGNLISQAQKPDQANDQLGRNLNQFKKDMPTLWQSLGAGIGNVIGSIKEKINEAPTVSPTETFDEFDESPSVSASPELQEIEGQLPLE